MKKNLILLVPLLTKEEILEYEKGIYFDRFTEIIYSAINESKSTFPLAKSQYYFSLYNYDERGISIPFYRKELFRDLRFLYHSLQYYYDRKVDFIKLMNDLNLIKEYEKFDKIFCFTITPNKQVFREIRPYKFFEDSIIIYRNIDLINASFFSNQPTTILEEKDFFIISRLVLILIDFMNYLKVKILGL